MTHNEIKEDLRKFFEILDVVEESDSGRSFHPTTISCCRALVLPVLNDILRRLKAASI